ncbi:uncharacterized protein LOC134266245, partial [Saccostrea cucullata]|uniref:uncharacterized protein LOC134266245 n=1 Tax=Saccostrea cuccullata TaxID=36930 RepID=UPI002ED3C987
MLRNMVGKRDETATLIIDEKDNAEDDINDSQPYPFTILDFLVAIVSIVVFVADIITDILLALEYKDHGRTAECALTSSVVVASFLVAGILSTIWYVQDGNGPKGGIQRTLFLIVAFPFATIIRKISYIKYGCLSRKSTDKHTHYKRMIRDRSDAKLLCMFDAFVESVPQV